MPTGPLVVAKELKSALNHFSTLGPVVLGGESLAAQGWRFLTVLSLSVNKVTGKKGSLPKIGLGKELGYAK